MIRAVAFQDQFREKKFLDRKKAQEIAKEDQNKHCLIFCVFLRLKKRLFRLRRAQAGAHLPIPSHLSAARQSSLKIKATRKVLPKSNLGKAIDYAFGQWPRLQTCFMDGRLEIDNNLIGNGIRPTKLGAKNWL